MPVTLARQDYLDVMAKKDTSAEEAGAHFDRMASFRAKLGLTLTLTLTLTPNPNPNP